MKKVYAVEKITSNGNEVIVMTESVEKAISICNDLNTFKKDKYVISKVQVLRQTI